jgi:hypothetical protein
MDSKIASKLWERVPQGGARQKRPDPRDFTSIPTENPRAALQSISCPYAELSVVIPLFDNAHGFRVQPIILVAQPVCGSALS